MVLGRDFIVNNYPRLPDRALPRPSQKRENPPREGSVSCCPVRLSPSLLPSRQRRRPFPSDHRPLHRTSRAPLPRTRRPGARAGDSSPLPAPPPCVMGWGSAGGEDRAGQPLGRAQHLPHLSSLKDGCTAGRTAGAATWSQAPASSVEGGFTLVLWRLLATWGLFVFR